LPQHHSRRTSLKKEHFNRLIRYIKPPPITSQEVIGNIKITRKRSTTLNGMVEATKHENKMMADGINRQYEHNQLRN
jgi:hypothetical protein